MRENVSMIRYAVLSAALGAVSCGHAAQSLHARGVSSPAVRSLAPSSSVGAKSRHTYARPPARRSATSIALPVRIAAGHATPAPAAFRTSEPSFATLAPVRVEALRDFHALEVPTLPPDAGPRIIAVQLPSQTVVGGQTIVGNVLASSNVASVEIRIANFSRVMQKVGEGRFTITVAVPRLPPLLRPRTYSLELIARNTRGDAVEETLPITVR